MSSPWSIYDEPKHDPTSPLRVHLFCSRNKDNEDVEGFRQRRRAFVANDSDGASVARRFERFVAEGVLGERSRWYASVNARDPERVRRELMHKLIDGESDLTRADALIAGIAARRECAAEGRWLFDFDDSSSCGYKHVAEFKGDLKAAGGFAACAEVDSIEVHKTPHGYAVIAPHGFDTRELLAKWGCRDDIGVAVELKRDDMLLRDWDTNGFEN